MRTIKFRGKRVDNGEWVYGYYFIGMNDTHWIVTSEFIFTPIQKEIVGQFTGLYDSTKWEDLLEEEKQDFYFQNCSEDGVTIKYKTKEEVKHLWQGRPIYENDIVSIYKDLTETYSRGNIENGTLEVWEEIVGNIDIKNGIIEYKGSSFHVEEYYLDTVSDCEIEVIGNIHDNKEILI